jgi:hypothetical protein
MHGTGVSQAPGGPQSAVALGLDGSMAALVPAHRALSWQLTNAAGTGIVRERNWLSFQPGEIRVCTSCHGINTASQTGDAPPTNEPEALRDLLVDWKLANGSGPGTPTPGATAGPGATATAGGATPAPTPTPNGNDPCTSAHVVVKPRLKAKVATAALDVSGSAVLPKPWTGVDPIANGMRLTVEDGLDVTIPGGAGWSVNAKGTRWRYDDPTGAHGGVRRIDLADKSSARHPGRLVFTIRLVGAAALPPLGPVDAAIRFGATAECARAHWNGPEADKPRCRGTATKLTCS